MIQLLVTIIAIFIILGLAGIACLYILIQTSNEICTLPSECFDGECDGDCEDCSIIDNEVDKTLGID